MEKIQIQYSQMRNFAYPANGEEPVIVSGQTICHICKWKIKEVSRVDENGDTIPLVHLDHDHYLKENNIRGWAHADCNKAFSIPKSLNCFIHNLKGYDSHLIMLGLQKLVAKRQ